MSHQFIGRDNDPPLAILVETLASPMLVAHPAPVCLEVDMDESLRLPVDHPSFCQLMESLVRQALLEMPEGGELTITGCETHTGVEIELADTGSVVASRACKLPLIAAALSAELNWQDCPQGGGAVTVKFPRYQAAQRRAA
ncbi:ATPase [Rhodopirellula halodulae]|uniref:ATPase n=1 Tax=Rhodopirellula halodulae TaxID=2894198 RepID=UPI001E304806|nr:ATPase [Rhodopirellula sp. JC737]MCC9657501.1 ATPase [Rhodopirellula sp. JC737]